MSYRSMSEIVRDQEPLVLPPETSVQDACRRIRERRIGAVLVAKPDHRLVGIFTGRDAVCRVLAEGRDAADTSLGEVMTPKPDCMLPRQNAIEALRLMQDGGFRHLPVVEAERVVGIVSRGDFRGLEQARLDEETGIWERMR